VVPATLGIFFPKEDAESTENARSGSLGLAKGQKVLGAVDRLGEALEEQLEVAVIIHEVDVAGVDDEEVARGVVEEEMFISGGYLLDV
jgi:hypothetical protein